MKKYKVGQILNRVKDALVIKNGQEYKRLTIRMYHKGVCLRDIERGENIGTKKQFIARSGQFIMSRIDARNGAFGIIPESINQAVITNDFLTFTVNENLVNIDFFELYSQTDNFLQLCIEGSKGTTNRKRLKEEVFLNFELHLPGIEEQVRLVRKAKSFKKVNELLNTEFDSQKKLVVQLRQSILQEAIQGKLVSQDSNDEPASFLLEQIKSEKERLIKEKKVKKERALLPITNDEIPFDLPKGWEWVRLASISSKLGAGSTPTGGKKVYTNNGTMFIRSQNVWNGGLKVDDIAYISDEINDKMQGSVVKPDDILLNITGASIGRSCILDKGFVTANVNQHVSIIRLIKPEMNPFIHKCIISPYIQKLILNVQVGVSREGLSMDKLGKFIFPIPPLNEQLRILNKIDQLMTLCDELEKNIYQSNRTNEILMQSVLQETFNQTDEEKDNVVEFSLSNSNDIEAWEIAARSDGEIDFETKQKIKIRVTELLGKSQQ